MKWQKTEEKIKIGERGIEKLGGPLYGIPPSIANVWLHPWTKQKLRTQTLSKSFPRDEEGGI